MRDVHSRQARAIVDLPLSRGGPLAVAMAVEVTQRVSNPIPFQITGGLIMCRRRFYSASPRFVVLLVLASGIAVFGLHGRFARQAAADEPGKTASTAPVAGDSAGGVQTRDDGKLRIVVFGAHPDDAELRAGGVGAMWAEAGHHVQLVSVTNGDIGHFAMAGGPLAQRRTAEVREASKILGTTSTVLDNHDGELQPTLENRRLLTRVIRRWNADIVIGHRPNDYHPDHRYVGVLMQDCAYMVGVPFFCPDVPPLAKNPLFLYSEDSFQRPNPFRADIVVAIDGVIQKKLDALVALESQFVEGGALGKPNPALATPAGLQKRRQQVREAFRMRSLATARQYRDKLVELYGSEAGKQVKHAEAFEICEYGRQPTSDEIRRLFPFFPEAK
jgi:LmbE family N-acetylglucosaminyl deacetylase